MRVDKLRASLGEAEGFLAARPENRFYFSGFTGTEGYALILPDKQLILVDFRYVEQAAAQCQGWQVMQIEHNIYEELPTVLAREKITSLVLEGDFWTYDAYLQLQEALPRVALFSRPEAIEDLRLIKEADELESIAQAVRIGDRAFEQLLPLIKPGVREQDLALELEFLMRKQGATGTSFTTIVASGSRSALPHGTASAKKLARGDLVVLDFGCIFEHYCSDMTRTVAVGQAGAREKEIYQIVLEAQLAGLEILQAGISGAEADQAARQIIEKAGYGDYFGHSTGHGVGLVIHEQPRLSKKSSDILQPGMVVTVEPGIYLPGWGGIRIEDLVVIQSGGCRNFTVSRKNELLIC